ncbi:MAG: hydrogenase maturation protease [Chloroflexota bacterium]|nr:hydrogenase maturation protease [Chloroflexota bacterium]
MEEVVQPASATKRQSRQALIACIGNIFWGDDGFGVEVAQRLLARQYPEGIRVVDFGIRGMDLAYALLDDYDELVLVDAVPRAGAPGTLYLLEPDLSGISPATGVEAGRAALDNHSMDPVKVLAYARALGAKPTHTLLVGCEPVPLSAGEDYPEMHMGLSAPVQAAVDEAVKMIDSLVEQMLAGEHAKK